jgi:hypothetical protein
LAPTDVGDYGSSIALISGLLALMDRARAFTIGPQPR